MISVKKELLNKIKLPNHPSFQWVIIMQLLKQKNTFRSISNTYEDSRTWEMDLRQ